VAGNAKGTFIFGHADSSGAEEPASGPVSPDSLGVPPADTLGAPPDSVRAPPHAKSEEKVIYSGDEVQFWVKTKIVDLRSDVTVDYGTLTLTAGKVRFFSDRRYMEAEDDPVLVDHGGDNKKVVGEHMDYNIHSHEGTISEGRTETESGFIYSDRLRQIGEKQFLARTGNFTTCDLAEKGKEPHFHFTSKKMRIYMNDKVIAKPVVLYIRDIPILAVPYYVFSIRKGRHSGFLAADLDLGLGSNTGRYFKNLGYYWAASQYWDLMGTAEYSETPSRFAVKGWLRYAQRRSLMSGQLNAKKVVGSPEYDVVGAHKMRLGAWDVNASLENRTGTIRQNDPLDPNLGARADIKLLSTLSVYRNILGRSGSVRVELRQDKLLNPHQILGQTTILNETLPQYVFSLSSRTLGRKGDENQPGRWPFLSNVRMSFSSSGSITHTVTQFGTVAIDTAVVDSSYADSVYTPVDSVFADTSFVRTSDRPKGAQHTFNISDTRKLGDFLNLSPQFTLTENWVDREFSSTDTTMGFHRAAVWNLSAGATTAVYGIIPGLGPLRALRHMFRPSAAFNYHPEFSSLTYAVKDSNDSTIARRSRFPKVSALESQFLSLRLEQSLEAKIGSAEHPKKISLFRWDLRTSYDFLAQDRGARPWSVVNSDFTQLLGSNLSFTSQHDPYHHFRLMNFQVTGVGYRLQGRLPAGGDDLNAEDVGTTTSDASPWTSLGGDQSLGSQPGTRRGESQPLSWSSGFGLSYGGSRNGDRITTQATITGGFEIQLTKNWNLSYRPIIWDVTNGKIDGDSFQLTRALHCWQAEFGRVRSGEETSFFLKIGIRDLPDIRYQLGRQSTGLQDFGSWLP
jgi:lipopolysaccharide transport LptD-like protein